MSPSSDPGCTKHRYHIHSPASQEFCDQALVSGYVNVLGTGTCGETGYSYSSELFGTLSYERDGRIESLPLENANPGELLRNRSFMKLQPVENRTIYSVGKDERGGLVTETLVFLDSSNTQISGVSDFYASSANQSQTRRLLSLKLPKDSRMQEPLQLLLKRPTSHPL
jgi:hypothetical protein